MRVFLKKTDLDTDAGRSLLELTVRIATDGKLDLPEIKELRSWLRDNRGNAQVAAIGFLDGIVSRVTADGVVDRDELLDLQLAIERVIPPAQRSAVVQARKKLESARKDRLREQRRIEREKEREDQERIRQEEYQHQMRLRHVFGKVVGVTFPNEDGSERQEIIKRCNVGEHLALIHDAYNEYSVFATQVLRTNGEQIGHAPEYLAERICEEVAAGYKAFGVITAITGGTNDKPTRGVNVAVFFAARDTPMGELEQYIRSVAPSYVKAKLIAVPDRAKPWWKLW